MIPVPSGVRVWLAVGRTDMRKGMNGLALQVQQGLGRDPHAGDLYVFRGVTCVKFSKLGMGRGAGLLKSIHKHSFV
jgi:transposase